MAPAKASTVKQLPLDELLRKYGKLSDSDFLNMVFSQSAAYLVDHPSGEALHPQTLLEYRSAARMLCRALQPEAMGMARDSLPSLAEMLCRKHGPSLIAQRMPICTELRKVAVMACSMVARALPELRPEDRKAAAEAWQATLRTARQACQRQVSDIGYGGDVSAEKLPSWSSIQNCIERLSPGCRSR